MKLKNKRDLWPAGLMLFIGLGTTWGSLDYGIGTLARMGPGYFPMLLGGTLIFVAVLILATPSSDEVSEQQPTLGGHYRSWIIVIVGMLAFMAVGKYGGFVPATFALIFLTALGDRNNSVKAALILATGVTAVSVAVFHYGMQLQFPLFTWG